MIGHFHFRLTIRTTFSGKQDLSYSIRVTTQHLRLLIIVLRVAYVCTVNQSKQLEWRTTCHSIECLKAARAK